MSELFKSVASAGDDAQLIEPFSGVKVPPPKTVVRLKAADTSRGSARIPFYPWQTIEQL